MTGRGTRSDKALFFEKVMKQRVFDTHTHLVGGSLGASSFWEIAHYFWLNRELQAGGYPANAEELSEEERIAAFLCAYTETRSRTRNRHSVTRGYDRPHCSRA